MPIKVFYKYRKFFTEKVLFGFVLNDVINVLLEKKWIDILRF
jgi:hypothetical protein